MSYLELLDERLFLFLNNLGSEQYDALWLSITNKLTWVPLYLLLLFYLYKRFTFKQIILIIITVIGMIAFADQLANLFKEVLVMRLRPCFTEHLHDKFRLVKQTCGGAYGFYSAHASNHMALAIFFIQVLKIKKNRYILLILLWAILIAYSRVYIGVHYPGDIIAGMFIGSFTGYLFYRILLYLNNKFQTNNQKL